MRTRSPSRKPPPATRMPRSWRSSVDGSRVGGPAGVGDSSATGVGSSAGSAGAAGVGLSTRGASSSATVVNPAWDGSSTCGVLQPQNGETWSRIIPPGGDPQRTGFVEEGPAPALSGMDQRRLLTLDPSAPAAVALVARRRRVGAHHLREVGATGLRFRLGVTRARCRLGCGGAARRPAAVRVASARPRREQRCDRRGRARARPPLAAQPCRQSRHAHRAPTRRSAARRPRDGAQQENGSNRSPRHQSQAEGRITGDEARAHGTGVVLDCQMQRAALDKRCVEHQDHRTFFRIEATSSTSRRGRSRR